eukprot:TRINITY_DN7824_c0_g3_i1.p1 TRINITY_DN7824_c0_g3~~TRINITY_DN7824_c0_g3_i1.p1  ORF type:complete len:109 (-),score=0.79 TRINITY_DN7824_c0_g3_i1:1029-1355(-)
MMTMTAMSGNEIEDFSASSTVITFDHPLPLLRGPIPASPSDDPSIGPFVLSFKDDRCWRLAYRATESKIIEQCEVSPIPILPSRLFIFVFGLERDAHILLAWKSIRFR